MLLACEIINNNSHSKPVLSKLLAKTESVTEYNLAAKNKTKQYNIQNL